MSLRNFLKSESGQSLAEYGLILALIAVVAIGVISKFGADIANKFSSASKCLESTKAAEASTNATANPDCK
ncbi:MAG TPA: Flp family type IVb pilin [Patescibacteria group bacterium]|nr:Flp family type IVb pilin [Patescibacteria group bacterium]